MRDVRGQLEPGDRVARITDVLRSFADATTDYPRLLDTIARQTAVTLGLHCSIRLLSDDGQRLDMAAAFGPRGEDAASKAVFFSRPFPLALSAGIRRSLETGQALAYSETPTGVAIPFEASIVDPARAVGLTSMIAAPLRARGRALGILFLVRLGPGPVPTREDVEMADALAMHAALALSNARALVDLEREIESRKRLEFSLAVTELSRQQKRAIVDAVPHPLLVVDVHGCVRSANRSFFELFGTTEGAVLDRSVWDVAGGALDTERLRRVVQLEPHGSPEVELTLVVAEGDARTVAVTVRPIPGPEDLVLLSFDDRTERLQASAKLRQRALLLESMGEAVVAGDLTFRIDEWNPAAERLFGWSESEVRGRPLEEFLVSDGSSRDRARTLVRAGERVWFQLRVKHRSGKWLDVEVSSMPLAQEGVTTGFVSVMKDITERLRLEREVDQRLAELELANRELESFSYSVSHDLRAPLRAIEGFASLLAECPGTTLDAEGERIVGVIRSNALRMGQLIDDLLAFARLGRHPLDAARINMEAIAREAAEEACRAERQRTYDLTIGPLPSVLGDRALLVQVWQNLLANAVKYTRGRSPAVITVDARTNGPEIVFRVRDNGVGFDMRYLDKLFAVFERLHSSTEFEGTGVGLAIVDRIVKRHGGRTWAEAELGKGAIFSFSLPNEDEDASE